MSRDRIVGIGIVMLACALLPACATRTVDTQLQNTRETEIYLRRHVRGGDTVARGYDHPLVVSPERLVHILALVDTRTKDESVEVRRTVFEDDQLRPAAAGLSRALSEAGPDDMVVVVSTHRARRLGVFTRKFLTTFIAFVKEDELWLDFSRILWEIPKQREGRLPRPVLGDEVMKFRIAPAYGMRPVGKQTLAVDWRDDRFAQARREGGKGKVRRREVLMEAPLPPAEPLRSDPER